MKIEIKPCHGECHELGKHCPDCDGYNHFIIFSWNFTWRDFKTTFLKEYTKQIRKERGRIFPEHCNGNGWTNQLWSTWSCLEKRSTLDKLVRIPQQNINWRVRLGAVAFDQGCMPVYCGVISEMYKIWKAEQ